MADLARFALRAAPFIGLGAVLLALTLPARRRFKEGDARIDESFAGTFAALIANFLGRDCDRPLLPVSRNALGPALRGRPTPRAAGLVLLPLAAEAFAFGGVLDLLLAGAIGPT